MCSRIQRQDYPSERRKKDVDLVSRPPLIRRPVTSASVERKDRKRLPSEVSRPYLSPSPHSPVRDLGPTPLQYAPPKLTALYDIAHKSPASSRSSTRKSSNLLPPVFERLTTSASIPCKLGQRSCESEPSSPRLCKLTDERCGRLRPTSNLEANTGEEPGAKSTHATPLPNECCCATLDQTKLERLQKDPSVCGPWSSSDEVTTASDLDYSSSLSRSRSDSSSKGALKGPIQGPEKDKPSFIRPLTDYTYLTERGLVPKLERHTSPLKLAQKPENLKHLSSRERLCTPPRSQLEIANMNASKASNINGGQNVVCDIRNVSQEEIKHLKITRTRNLFSDIENIMGQDGNQPSSYMDSHAVLREIDITGQENTSTTESRWLKTPRKASPRKTFMELEKMDYSNQKEVKDAPGGQAVPLDDSNVLIKHSSDPYTDFRLSMVTMIEEEGLQQREAELEELFQYYVDLNPKVHHEVLHRVIGEIKTDLLKGCV